MNQQQLDYLHDQGKMPDWAYYQQSDKPLYIKWQEQTDKLYQEHKQKIQLSRDVQEQVEIAIDNALERLSKKFNS